MTPSELIKDTIEYYRKNPRATVNGSNQCSYRTQEGNMCAVGRWIDWEIVEEEKIDIHRINSIGSIGSHCEESKDIDFLYSILKKEVITIPFRLWVELQNYHDDVLCQDKNYILEVEQKLLNIYKN